MSKAKRIILAAAVLLLILISFLSETDPGQSLLESYLWKLALLGTAVALSFLVVDHLEIRKIRSRLIRSPSRPSGKAPPGAELPGAGHAGPGKDLPPGRVPGTADRERELEAEIKELHAVIGRLTLERDALQDKLKSLCRDGARGDGVR